MKRWPALLCLTLLLAACSTTPPDNLGKVPRPNPAWPIPPLQASKAGPDILMYAMSLLGVDYKFGGSNPEAGLDCSGMVSYIYRNAVGVKLPHNAAQIAGLARPIDSNKLKIGDLVFFNTLNRPFSHMGIYIGEGKFVHAPRSNSVIRVDRLNNRYFASRFDGARTLFSS